MVLNRMYQYEMAFNNPASMFAIPDLCRYIFDGIWRPERTWMALEMEETTAFLNMDRKMADILEDLADLHKQATTERSHYYMASCCKRAAEEISKLRNDRDAWKRACEVYAARMKAEQQFAEDIHKADKEPPEASFDNVEDMPAWLNDEPAGS